MEIRPGIRFWIGVAIGAWLSVACVNRAGSNPSDRGEKTQRETDAAADAGHGPALPCIATLVSSNCALGGCHDSETREHGMDLSNGESVFEAWVNRNGLNACGNVLEPRVTPFDLSNSLVWKKLTGDLRCTGPQSQPMPPPPLLPLSDQDLDSVRTWIEGGAHRDCHSSRGPAPDEEDGASASGSEDASLPNPDGTLGTGGFPGLGDGTASAGRGSMSTGGNAGVPPTPADAGSAAGSSPMVGGAAATSTDAGKPEPSGDSHFQCDIGTSCISGLACVGESCANTSWACMSHFEMFAAQKTDFGDSPRDADPNTTLLNHSCPEEVFSYCRCDGQTIDMPLLCPNQPYDHIGACGDGFNCDAADVSCDVERPTCPEGQKPSVVNGCYAACVAISECRCQFFWECTPEGSCNNDSHRCQIPTAVDAGSP